MADREKLIECLKYCASTSTTQNNCHGCQRFDLDCGSYHCVDDLMMQAAAALEQQKWIPVTERLPETIPCNAGTAYSEAVNVLTTGRKVLTAIYDGIDFIADAEFWEAEGEEITHWTPVLLPLPEPPKGE